LKEPWVGLVDIALNLRVLFFGGFAKGSFETSSFDLGEGLLKVPTGIPVREPVLKDFFFVGHLLTPRHRDTGFTT
jgi:hypothetical protein